MKFKQNNIDTLLPTVARQDSVDEEIARVAYHYWETRGGGEGHALDDWLMAEQEVLRRRGIRSRSEEREKRASTAA